MKFTNFALLYITISFGVGIVISNYLNLTTFLWLCISTPLFICFCYLLVFFKHKFKEQTVLFTIISLCTFIAIGALNYNLHKPLNQKNHYTNYKQKIENLSTFRITRVLKDNRYYSKFYAEVTSVNKQQSSGTVLIQLKKTDSLSSNTTVLKIDDHIISKTQFTQIKPAINPGQFNYKNYLKHKGVYHQVYLDNTNFKFYKQKNTSYLGYNAWLISIINNALKKFPFKTDELAIINALVLGQKQDISNEIYSSYTDSGAIHILAVSGLHVGIILLIITFFLKPLKSIKHGWIITIVISVTLLWLYAFLTGASPSVVRAATMFTMVSIALNLKRKTNIYNTLIGSIFVILLFKPQFLFDIGFQLSYAAVFSIVSFQPIIVKLYNPSNKFLKIYWQTLSVTLSAQFGVIPLSLFYFHQIPGLFWLSNLIIIPLLPIIIGLTLLVITLVLFLNKFTFTHIFASVLSYIIAGMNYLLKWISSYETFIIKEISFNYFNLIASILCVICIYALLKNIQAKTIINTLASVILLQLSFIYPSYYGVRNEFIVFHKSKQNVMATTANKKLMVYSNNSLPNYVVTNYKIANHITQTTYYNLPSALKHNDKLVLIVDSLGIYNLAIKPEVVVLIQSPKINLERLIDILKPSVIISDGSNYKSYAKTWEATCKNKKVLFHNTEKGAFVMR